MNSFALLRSFKSVARYTQNELPPLAITPQIQGFAATLGELVWVTYQPDTTATQGLCFPNVEARIAREGGQPVYGWKLRENTHYISAEWHTVWRSPAGNLVDITPDQDKPERTLFVIDTSFSGVPVSIPPNRNRAKTIAGARTLKKLREIKEQASHWQA